MDTAVQLATLLTAIGTAAWFAEITRRHVVCLRFERELRGRPDQARDGTFGSAADHTRGRG